MQPNLLIPANDLLFSANRLKSATAANGKLVILLLVIWLLVASIFYPLSSILHPQHLDCREQKSTRAGLYYRNNCYFWNS